MSHETNDRIIDDIKDGHIHCTCIQLFKDGIIGCCDWCDFVMNDGDYEEDGGEE